MFSTQYFVLFYSVGMALNSINRAATDIKNNYNIDLIMTVSRLLCYSVLSYLLQQSGKCLRAEVEWTCGLLDLLDKPLVSCSLLS